jgi:hypothetical protein
MQASKSFLILLIGYGILSLLLGLADWVQAAQPIMPDDVADIVYQITRGIAASVAGIALFVAKRRHSNETALPTRYRVVVGLCIMVYLFGVLFQFATLGLEVMKSFD